MSDNEDKLGYIVVFNLFISFILICVFLCLRRCRKDSPTFIKGMNYFV